MSAKTKRDKKGVETSDNLSSDNDKRAKKGIMQRIKRALRACFTPSWIGNAFIYPTVFILAIILLITMRSKKE